MTVDDGVSPGSAKEAASLTPSSLVAARLKEARRRHGWTAKQLAEQCAKAGATGLTAAVLANIESGRPDADGRRRRDITVDELLLLAYVLDVAPIYLLALPNSGQERAAQIAPRRAVNDPDELLRWIRGDQALTGTDARMYYSVALERMPAPDTEQTLAEYARSVLQDRAKELVSQFHAETDELAARAHNQITRLITDAEQALAGGASADELVALLRDAGRVMSDRPDTRR